MQGMIPVKDYTSAAEMRAAHAATRARLFNPANTYRKPAPVLELVTPQPKPAPVPRHWPVQFDSHVTTWKLATYRAQVKSLEMSLRNSVDTINRMVGEIEEATPRISAMDVCRGVLLECATRGEGSYSMAEITGPRRNRRLINVRHKCMAAVVVSCKHLSYPQIGRFFNRDHTSILSAAKKMGVQR